MEARNKFSKEEAINDLNVIKYCEIDPEKFEQALLEQRKYQQECQRKVIEKANSFYEGYTACLDEVSSMLYCSNYESKEKKTQRHT